MYEAFYGLKSKPFQLNPDPNFYFASKQHRRARAYLEYGVSRNEGFIVITGEIGAGKTMVLRSLIDSLSGSNVVTGHLVTTQLGAEDTLRMVGAAFGFRVKDVPKSELLITLEAFLISQTSKGKRCLLIVDEAQNLTPRAVEELRMLSNFQFGNQALLQSFLVGQPEFREILQRPEVGGRNAVAHHAEATVDVFCDPAATVGVQGGRVVGGASAVAHVGIAGAGEHRRPVQRPRVEAEALADHPCSRLLQPGPGAALQQADQHPGCEIAEYRAQPDGLDQRHKRDAGRQNNEDGQKDVVFQRAKSLSPSR